MALIIKEVSSNTVTEVGNVIIIEGGGLTPDQATKLANVPSDTNTELALKAPLASPAFTGTPTGITKSHVGLGNVDNTSDANKPVSTPQQTALDLKADSTDIDIINTALSSKADLVAGKVPASQLPEGIDEVQEYANLAAFPATGATNIIYVAIDTNKTYRWGGTVYAETSSSLALGSTSSTAHRGDHGATAYTHSQVTSGNPHGVTKSDVGLSNADNTSDANKPISTAQQAALDLKANLASPTFTGTVGGISKAMVGLGNVDNTSDLNKPISTATQAALDLKAEPGDYAAAISITGTHDETTTAIDFSSVQGKATTLTANRTFTVSTGLSASNPIGYHLVTHANFTPTYSDVDVVLDSPLNKSGKYYLKFTRQPDGTITQSNQSGGGGVSTFDELTDITTSATSVNKIDLILALYAPAAPTIATALNGTQIDITITPGAENSDFATNLYNIYRSTDGSNFSLYDTTTQTTYNDSGLSAGTYYYYVTSQNNIAASSASNTDNETVASLTTVNVNLTQYTDYGGNGWNDEDQDSSIIAQVNADLSDSEGGATGIALDIVESAFDGMDNNGDGVLPGVSGIPDEVFQRGWGKAYWGSAVNAKLRLSGFSSGQSVTIQPLGWNCQGDIDVIGTATDTVTVNTSTEVYGSSASVSADANGYVFIDCVPSTTNGNRISLSGFIMTI